MAQQGFSQQLNQGLSLSPKALQSIEFLQMAGLDLAARIEAELESNETLELIRPAALCEQGRDGRTPEDASDLGRGSPGRAGGEDRAGGDWAFDVADRAHSFVESVRSQLRMLGLSESVETAALRILDSLDHRGFLSSGRDALQAELGPSGFAAGLAALDRCEPRGLGTAGPIEALLAQLDGGDPDRSLVERILTEFLEDLAHERLTEVASAVDLTETELESLLDRIRGVESDLEQGRGEAFGSEERAPTICDLVVERDVHGRFAVRVSDLVIPLLRVDAGYGRMAEDPSVEAPVRRYLRPKLRAARELVSAVEMRQTTLARVGSAIFEEQARFLRDGFEAIVPLRMDRIADLLDLHPSTVSRAVSGKWVATPHGPVALRRFFDGGRSEQAVLGRQAVLATIRSMIESEDPKGPLSDQRIRDLLRLKGIDLARRTVAKYRTELGFEVSTVRARRSARRRRQSPLQ